MAFSAVENETYTLFFALFFAPVPLSPSRPAFPGASFLGCVSAQMSRQENGTGTQLVDCGGIAGYALGMARKPQFAPGGLVYHVLNRSAGRSILFRRDGDFRAFERLLVEAHRRVPLRLLSYCVTGNHWHFVAWPERDGQLTEFGKGEGLNFYPVPPRSVGLCPPAPAPLASWACTS